MKLNDPFAAYNAATDHEAQMVRLALMDAGIAAFVIEDQSIVGTWVFGYIPEINKPQVWIERADIDRAKPVLDQFEKRNLQLRMDDADEDDDTAAEIEVQCEECGEYDFYPAVQKGSVQVCWHCKSYVDVEEGKEDDWIEGEAEEP